MSDYNPSGAPFTGKKFLAVMLGFFGVIIGVNLLMAWLAIGSFPGVIVESGYVASQDFNDDSKRFAAQAERGWVVATDEAAGLATITISGPDGAAVPGLTLTVRAIRPTDERMDADLAFEETAPGVYVARENLAAGQWRLSILAEGVGDRWSDGRDLIVKAR